jgi:hypothetical protein
MIPENVKLVALVDSLNMLIKLPVCRFDGNRAGNRDRVMWHGLGAAL